MSYGLYIHLPFCRQKCPYCSFASFAGREDIIGRYTDACAVELKSRRIGQFAGSPETVYVGGGTPSIVPAALIKRIIKQLDSDEVQEFTIEANPDSLCPVSGVNEQWLEGMLEAGANRISIGVQSLDDGILDKLGRIHSSQQAVSSVSLCRRMGFENISVDLMFGVPGQTLEIWQRTLEGVLKLEPNHVSAYSLTVEEDTVYYEQMHHEGLDIPDSLVVNEMYVMMKEMLENEGLFRYEISNFSRTGYECRHNRGYWNFTPYLGIGSSAHSFDGLIRSWNEPEPQIYIENCHNKSESTAGSEIIDDRKRALETVMLSLRTAEGLDLNKFDIVNEGTGAIRELFSTFIASGFLAVGEGRTTRLTDKGAVLADEIIAEIASMIEDCP